MARNRLNEISVQKAVGTFTSGNTVTITIYDVSDNSNPATSSLACAEIGTTGIFKWPFSNITTAPTSYIKYLYIMTNGSLKQTGVEEFGGWTEDIIVGQIPASICKVSVSLFESDGDETLSSEHYNETQKPFAQITGGNYQASSSKYFRKNKRIFDERSAGVYSWFFPQGATVRFKIKESGIDSTVTIPSASTASLYDLINP